MPISRSIRSAFCSVASASHQAQSLTSLLSVREHHPHAKFLLLCIDCIPKLPDGIDALSLEDCIPANVLASMRARYDLAELCFAAKPYLLSTILNDTLDQVHYLDGDCLALASFDPLLQQLADADLLLTPHALSPVPDDGLRPRPLTLLRGGVFNAGYLGVRNTAQGNAFLAWLSEMTRDYGHNAPKQGMCGDQRWLDLAPVLFPGAAICRHPGANVAYWNLHERRLSICNDQLFKANDEPLLFFHFSGFDSEDPAELSCYQNRHPIANNSPLALLIQHYREMLSIQDRSSSLTSVSPRRRWFRRS